MDSVTSLVRTDSSSPPRFFCLGSSAKRVTDDGRRRCRVDRNPGPAETTVVVLVVVEVAGVGVTTTTNASENDRSAAIKIALIALKDFILADAGSFSLCNDVV